MNAAQAADAGAGTSLFKPAVATGIVLVGVFAFCLFFIGTALDNGGREDLDGGAHTLSKSAVGYAGAADLIKRMGRPVMIARGPVRQGADQSAVMVLTIDKGDPKTNLQTLPTTEGFQGPILAIIPKWETRPMPRKLGWVGKAGLRDVPIDQWIGPTREGPKIRLERGSGRRTHRLSAINADGVVQRTVATGVIETFQTLRPGAGWRPLVVDDTGGVVLMVSRDDSLYVLSEPDLFNNHGIADLANARAGLFVLGEFSPPGEAVIFDVTLNGFERARSLLKLMFQPPFLAATICAFAAALLMIWHGFFRFGREAAVVREFALGKRALADNQAALIKMARREHRLGGRYGVVIRDLAARAVGAPKDLTPEQLDAFLDRLGSGGRTSWPLSTLRSDIETARDSTDLVKAAHRLHHWRLEISQRGR